MRLGRWARLPPIRPHPSVRFQPAAAPPPLLVVDERWLPASPVLVGAACPSGGFHVSVTAEVRRSSLPAARCRCAGRRPSAGRSPPTPGLRPSCRRASASRGGRFRTGDPSRSGAPGAVRSAARPGAVQRPGRARRPGIRRARAWSMLRFGACDACGGPSLSVAGPAVKPAPAVSARCDRPAVPASCRTGQDAAEAHQKRVDGDLVAGVEQNTGESVVDRDQRPSVARRHGRLAARGGDHLDPLADGRAGGESCREMTCSACVHVRRFGVSRVELSHSVGEERPDAPAVRSARTGHAGGFIWGTSPAQERGAPGDAPLPVRRRS